MTDIVFTDLHSLISNFPENIDSINKSYIDLLTQLTITNHLQNDVFFEQINKIYTNNSKIFIIHKSSPNNPDFIIVATITCFIEPKIIRNARFSAHIEDFVVHNEYRNKGFASKLLSIAKNYASDNNCYKILLDCEEKLVPFYNKFGFTEKGRYMTLYIDK